MDWTNFLQKPSDAIRLTFEEFDGQHLRGLVVLLDPFLNRFCWTHLLCPFEETLEWQWEGIFDAKMFIMLANVN